MKNQKDSLVMVKEKKGRVDVLLARVADRILDRVVVKSNLPGLKNGLMPLLDHEIKKHIPKETAIPEQFNELAKLVAGYIK